MRTIRGLESYPSEPRTAVVALGVFDGVHLGHRAILGAAVARARQAGLAALACTFDPHPAEVLQPDRAPARLTTVDERLALIAQTGIEATVVVEFSVEIAAIEAEAFVKDVLVGCLAAREVVVGFDHRFGRGARGDAHLLEALGERLGFVAHVVPPLMVGDVPVSSTEIRAALQRGDLTLAGRYLGRPYTIRGRVVAGAGRGRTLGFPTANLRPERPVIVPPGVYGCRAAVRGARHPAVVNIGVRPTFGEGELAVEAHLLDFTGDLYGETLVLELVARIREERRFPSLEALRRQIARDID
ncbi:MAG TPA: bifunctional riboflavin kinase/FAD synthetase, partial [Methylomirabilota bacterium]|nr:bifunctional riboflavin kinase/FAD synthetase [Methylomirabilota bacterium]